MCLRVCRVPTLRKEQKDILTELDEDVVVLLKGLLEVGLGYDQDVLLGLDLGEGQARDNSHQDSCGLEDHHRDGVNFFGRLGNKWPLRSVAAASTILESLCCRAADEYTRDRGREERRGENGGKPRRLLLFTAELGE